VSNVYAVGDPTAGNSGTTDSRYASVPPVTARLTRPILLCLTVVCALFLLARYAVLPVLTVRHIVFQSDLELSEDELLAISGLQGTAYWHSLATETIRKRLEAYPLIRKAVVEKVFPDTVRMTVWGRRPVALVLADMGGRSLPVLVDDEGVVFKVCADAADLDLPVVSGLPAADASLGSRLPGAYAPLFQQLRLLRDKSPSLTRLLSEVRIISHGPQDPQGNYDLLIYLTSSPVPVRAGGTLDESLLRYSLMVLDLLSNQGVLKNIQELDFRSGDVVYRMKEG
jgi:cell division protein FtsQ